MPKLGPVSKIRVYFVTADDEYGHSVADATRTSLEAGGLSISGESVYNPYTPNWTPVMQAIAAAKPDILVLSSHIQDGIAFRRAFLAAGLSVKVFMGTTMAQCDQDFGNVLGSGAVGVFASDRPQANFNPDALDPQARALYNRFAALWKQRTGDVPSEEGIAGFSAAWVLFADVLGRAGSDGAQSIAAAARSLNLPEGSLPNGARRALLDGTRPARSEHPRGCGRLAVAGTPRQRRRLAADLRHRTGEARAARVVIG